MVNITGIVRRAIEDYKMIEEGDIIAVGVSGGKDSVALLSALSELRRYYNKRFELRAISLDMGFTQTDYTPLKDFCERIDVPYTVIDTRLAELIFDVRREKNPCALCSKMRRGALNDTIREMGIKKLALGHHMDDAIETFMMSLLYEGRITCFQPVTYMSRSGVTQIRPLIYCKESEIMNYVARMGLPVVKNPCPMDGSSSREEIKKLIESMSLDYSDLKAKIFGAIQRYPLKGWDKEV